MAINKKTREAVYQKYGGRCAYCGRAIAYKDMQVDRDKLTDLWEAREAASDLKIYDHPRPLSDFTRLRATKFGYEPVRIEHPPQSWFYVEEKP